jgi:hypothetical protein
MARRGTAVGGRGVGHPHSIDVINRIHVVNRINRIDRINGSDR